MTQDHNPLVHAQALIRCPSVTPDQAGALDYMERCLGARGFTCHRLAFGGEDGPEVENLYARLGDGAPHLCFAGHIDVVPPGDEAAWTVPPFAAEVRGDVLYGRGAVDMKGGVAAMMAAAFRYIDASDGRPKGSISFLITADEEGPARYGTRAVVDWMRAQGEQPDHCLLGEATNPERVGQEIKIGRRGSLSAELTVRGKQGHVAYPHLTNNPVSGLLTALKAVIDERFDEGSENFLPSNLEVTSLNTSSGAVNVVPAMASAKFNIRFNDHHSVASLETHLRALIVPPLEAAGLKYELAFESNADVFLTQPGPWVETLVEAVRGVTGLTPELATGGGTSDARFIKDICPVVEFGPLNKTIHAVDEHIPLADLEAVMVIYQKFMERYFG
jgi:succinyl-diaminopimelate desuccinylase